MYYQLVKKAVNKNFLLEKKYRYSSPCDTFFQQSL